MEDYFPFSFGRSFLLFCRKKGERDARNNKKITDRLNVGKIKTPFLLAKGLVTKGLTTLLLVEIATSTYVG